MSKWLPVEGIGGAAVGSVMVLPVTSPLCALLGFVVTVVLLAIIGYVVEKYYEPSS